MLTISLRNSKPRSNEGNCSAIMAVCRWISQIFTDKKSDVCSVHMYNYNAAPYVCFVHCGVIKNSVWPITKLAWPWLFYNGLINTADLPLIPSTFFFAFSNRVSLRRGRSITLSRRFWLSQQITVSKRRTRSACIHIRYLFWRFSHDQPFQKWKNIYIFQLNSRICHECM